MPLGAATLTAVVDGTNSFVTVTASATSMTAATFWRRTPSGDVYLRGGIGVAGAGSAVIIDYDAPQNTPITYYAQVTDGVSTASAGPTTTAGEVDRGGDALYDISTPDEPLLVTVTGFAEQKTDVKQDVVVVIGRADPVVVSDVRQYPSGTLSLATLNAADRRTLNALLASGDPIAFSPANFDYGIDDTWFLSVGTVTEKRLSPLGIVAERGFDLEVRRVATPPAVE